MLKRQQIGDAPIKSVIDDIVFVHEEIRADWADSHGWAPRLAAEVLGQSRLDWLSSLAESLRLWFRDDIRQKERDGCLILAWANLGALVEGSMKFFLTIYIEHYLEEVQRGQVSDKANFFRSYWNRDRDRPRNPDDLMLDKLRQFFDQVVWDDTRERKWSSWVLKIAQNRNAIHAYQSRDIGTFDHFEADVREYRRFLTDFIRSRLPPPPDRSHFVF